MKKRVLEATYDYLKVKNKHHTAKLLCVIK